MWTERALGHSGHVGAGAPGSGTDDREKEEQTREQAAASISTLSKDKEWEEQARGQGTPGVPTISKHE